MATFEGYERREAKILSVLKEYGINSIDECKTICEEKGIDPYTIVQETQPICFENAKWAYTVGCAIAIKMGCTKAADAAAAIGIGLQAFCIPGSVAENRKVGLGHGNLGKMLLSEETECFAFLAGHESFAAAEGAIKIALNANKVRRSRCALSSTVSARTLRSSSPESTALRMLRPSSIRTQKKLRLSAKRLIPTARVRTLSATAQITFRKALQS